MEEELWFDSGDHFASPMADWPIEAYEAKEAIEAAAEELGPLDLIMFDLHTNVATRFVAMSLPRHRHDQNCGRA